MAKETIKYQTSGTCCKMILLQIENNDTIVDAEFLGGCNGNLQGISAIVVGKTVDEVANAFEGIRCGMRPTSCPDQLVKALRAAQQAQAQA